MDKPIPEAVVKLLHAANVYLYQIDFGDEGKVDYVRAEDISRLLTAAQQPDHIVDATKMVAQQQGQAEPPSAPVGVGAMPGIRKELAKELAQIVRRDEGELVWIEPNEADAILRALAQQPAAVDGAWQVQLADALECFWNAAIDGSGRDRDNIIGGMVQGFAAVATRLREHATHHQEPTT